MHDEMRVRQAAVDLLDHLHSQDLTVRLAAELVGAVRGAHRDRKRIDLGGADEIDRLVRVGEQLVAADGAFRAVAVLLFAPAMFERAEHAELAFHRRADPMRHVRDASGDVDIIGVGSNGLGVGLERAIHHDRGEAVLDRGRAGGFIIAMILVQAERDVRIHLDQRIDHPGQHDVAGIAARSARGLNDDGRIDGIGRLHDRKALFHIVDVEGRHAVAALSSMVEQLPQGDLRHRLSPDCGCHGELHCHRKWSRLAARHRPSQSPPRHRR